MTRKRLTRLESRELTLQRLLAAGQHLIAKQGFAATSVENIASAAGYTRGAFYAHFRGKDDIFLAVLLRAHAHSLKEFQALTLDDNSLEQIQSRALELHGCLYRDSEHFMCWTEARMYAVRNVHFRGKINALTLERRSAVARFIDDFLTRTATIPPMPPNLMADGLISLIDGLLLFSLSSPMDNNLPDLSTVLSHYIGWMLPLSSHRSGQRIALRPNCND